MGYVRLKGPHEEWERESEMMKISLGLIYFLVLCRFFEGMYMVHVYSYAFVWNKKQYILPGVTVY